MNEVSLLFDEQKTEMVPFAKNSQKDHLNYLSHLFNFFRYVQFKPPIPPDLYFISKEWYSTLSNPFPIEYIQTVPTKDTGMASFREFDRLYEEISQSYFDVAYSWLQRFYVGFSKCEILDDFSIKSYMVRTTSPGWPFKKVKKSDYLDHPNFSKHIAYLDTVLSGNFSPFFWKWAQKYELRSLEKAALKKIRGFCVSPVDHCYFQSRYCIDFNENFYKLSLDFESPFAVGMSKYYLGFSRVYKYISRHKNIFYSDCTGFDSRISPQMSYNLFCFKTRYMGLNKSDLCKFWNVQGSNVYSPFVLENGEVWYMAGGNSSGQSNTIVDNTNHIALLFMMGYFYSAVRANKEVTFNYFRNNVCFKCYGDDVVFSVSDEVLPWFNFDIWNEFMLLHGFILKGNSSPVDKYGAEFLSHKIINYDGIDLPVPDETKILSSLVEGSTNNNSLFVLLRAMSLRLESWPSLKCRRYIEDFIDFCLVQKLEYLQGTYDLAPGQSITLQQVKDLYFSDYEILTLYTGYEGKNSHLDERFNELNSLICWL
jgi:hypothetical protein